ncbi:hypothetical protein SAY86_031217 [Trapa natans]|uniref:Uncharacterized protein n=1 Tax=Trapa natans TaxID=22666 RepID=A0AAN7R3C6_TRANT|nr:hypothetical protein SAY86_031217 [Trapa natans]
MKIAGAFTSMWNGSFNQYPCGKQSQKSLKTYVGSSLGWDRRQRYNRQPFFFD